MTQYNPPGEYCEQGKKNAAAITTSISEAWELGTNETWTAAAAHRTVCQQCRETHAARKEARTEFNEGAF